MNIQTNGFTILPSSHSSGEGVFLDSLQNDELGKEYGTLFISNRDGRQMAHSLTYTNREAHGYVDFARVEGIPGLILVNQVGNHEQLGIGNSAKKEIHTLFSLNNGATWGPLKAPERDSDGKEYCRDLEGCRLNLHLNSASKHSNSNAAGVVIAVGISMFSDMYRKCGKVSHAISRMPYLYIQRWRKNLVWLPSVLTFI